MPVHTFKYVLIIPPSNWKRTSNSMILINKSKYCAFNLAKRALSGYLFTRTNIFGSDSCETLLEL